ncbi:MAG: hypothetical protein PHO66_08225, partial [Eubacteriales bacterium]|nr:hypothetical protein [Eubacteriales bacterium]
MKRSVSRLAVAVAMTSLLAACGTENGADLKITDLPDNLQPTVVAQDDSSAQRSDLLALLLP